MKVFFGICILMTALTVFAERPREEVLLTPLALPKAVIAPNMTHIVNFHILIFENSGWDLRRVQDFLHQAQQIYNPCGIQLNALDAFLTQVPNTRMPLNKHTGTVNGKWSLETFIQELPMDLDLPTIFFVKDFSDAPSTVFTQYDFIWVPFDAVYQTSYDILAQEITLLLLQERKSSVMSYCQELKKNSFVVPLRQ